MSSIAPRYDLNESGYSLQLRPMKTDKEDRSAGNQHFAIVLWLRRGGMLYEICALSGMIIPLEWASEGGTRELLERAKRLILMTQDDWNALKKDEQRALQPSHLRWLAADDHVAQFTAAIDAEIAKRS